jgi:hypothetical protein
MDDVRAAPQIDLDFLDWDRQYTTRWELENVKVQVHAVQHKLYRTGIRPITSPPGTGTIVPFFPALCTPVKGQTLILRYLVLRTTRTGTEKMEFLD